MILFQTKFPISEELTYPIFLDMLSEWIRKSKHYDLQPVFEESTGEFIFESDTEKLMVYVTETFLAAQLCHRKDSDVYTNTYILTHVDEVYLAGIRLERSVLEISSEEVSLTFRLPRLLRELFWQEYGGQDGPLFVDDKSYILRKNDTALVEMIFDVNQSMINPVVYISPFLSNGTYAVDYDGLAGSLLGMAHVVVEGSPYVTKIMQDVTGGKTPMNGAVSVIFPNGGIHTFAITDDYGREILQTEICNYVYRSLANLEMDDAFSFQKLRFQYYMEHNDVADLNEICEELLSEREQEVVLLKSQVQELQERLLTAEQKNLAWRYCQQGSEQSPVDVGFAVTEKDLYDHEISDVILKVLKKEHQAMTGDTTLMLSRKYHVLSDILEHNTFTGHDEEVRKAFKKAVQTGTMTNSGIREMERYGFSVKKNGKSHYQVIYQNDERYMIGMSTTPSDKSSGHNLASTYMNMCFGY